MIKYKLGDLAKDLNMESKDIADMIKEQFNTVRKPAAVLTEEELNFVFEKVTRDNSVPNFEKYFASKNDPIEGEKTVVSDKKDKFEKSEKKDRKSDKDKKDKNDRFDKDKKEKQDKFDKDKKERKEKTDKPEKSENKKDKKFESKSDKKQKNTVENKNRNTNDKKPVQNNSNNQKPSQKPAKQNTETDISQSEGSFEKRSRVINTRQSNVDIERYNEKYDRLASEKMHNVNTGPGKQKINQRSQQRGKPKNSRKETEAERMNRIEKERKTKPITVQIPDEITVGELALRLKARAAEVIMKLMSLGVMASVNDNIDFDTASLVALEFHARIEKETIETIEERIIDDSDDDDENLVPRAPVVVVMGHVDHGKTSLLDAIRHANVTSTEAGGITQHIGAYRVNIDGRDITFLDTPGHEAFTTMRARGAQVTDIAILVVAADDGIMPQTIEAINHAKAAGVSIIVAANKIDKPAADINRVKTQLMEYEIVPEDFGGDTPVIGVSAKTKENLNELLEMVLLIADMKELKANPERAAKGTVIEARLDKGRGPVATVLVQNGTLNVGDIIVAGTTVGRVRAMSDDKGNKVKSAGPSVPVEITGLDNVPTGGDVFNAVLDERLARELVDQRKTAQKEERFNARTKITLDNLFDQMKLEDMKELKIIVKADVQGSVEAVRQSLEKLSNDEIRVNVIHSGVGAIRESDVMLASASNAIIVGFNVRPDPVAEENAKNDGVDMRLYRVIYDCIEEIQAAMKGMLAPKFKETILGKVEVRQTYKITNVGLVSGSYVLSGKVVRGASVRVVRDGIVIADDTIASLQRFKDSVKEVAQGFECGITLERFSDIKEGDIFEVYQMEQIKE